MKVRDIDSGEEINEVELRDSLFGKMIGLMFRKEGRALLDFGGESFPTIWMPFMRFSLDLAFLNKDMEIVDIVEDVSPIGFNPRTWKIHRPQERSRYVLEVESGLLSDKGIKVGSQLELEKDV